MKKNLLKVLLFLVFSISSFAGKYYGDISELKLNTNYKQITDFVPYGWKISDMIEGDLNKDKINDAVVILESTYPEYNLLIKKQNSFSENEENPKIVKVKSMAILVLFKNKNSSYTLVSKNANGFLMGWDGYHLERNDSYIVAEPITEQRREDLKKYGIEVVGDYYKSRPFVYLGGLGEDIKIRKNNTLLISMHTQSYNAWDADETVYIFRWQNNRFEVIGYSSTIYEDGGMQAYCNKSVNLLTNKMKIKNFLFYTDERDYDRPKVDENIKWKKVNLKRFSLDELGPKDLYLKDL